MYDSDANVCVVNSASSDESLELVQGYHVQIINAPQGYAQALSFGYRYACEQDWDSLVQLDGDGQHHPMYAKGLHDNLKNADWVIGSRQSTGSYGNWGVRVSSWMGTKFYLSGKFMDPSSGYWALNKMMIKRFDEIFPVLYTELPLRMSQMETARILEYPIPMRMREKGTSMNAGLKGIIHGLHMMVYAHRMQKKL